MKKHIFLWKLSWHTAAVSVMDFLSKIFNLSVWPICTVPCCHQCSGFFCWLKSYNSATIPWKAYFSQLIFTALSCRECCGFFDLNYWLVSGANSHGTLLLSVRWFFCWLKSYNSALFPWKIILFSANFHGTQLPRVPWIFWLKLLTTQVTQL